MLSVTPRGLAFLQEALLHCGAPLFGQLQAQFAALVGLVIERLSDRRRAAYLAQLPYLDVEVSCFGSYMEMVAGVDLARRLRLVPIGDDAPQITRPCCERARLEEARRPEPFVRSDTGHGSIVVQARRSLCSLEAAG